MYHHNDPTAMHTCSYCGATLINGRGTMTPINHLWFCDRHCTIRFLEEQKSEHQARRQLRLQHDAAE